MLLATGAAIVTAMLSVEAVIAAPPPSRAEIQAGLKQAQCTIPAAQAKIVGSEWLARDLQIVEVSCWKATGNTGSILFAVPAALGSKSQLIAVEDWRDGRVVSSYSVASPAYDRDTRTLSSTHKSRVAGDCGTIKEWQWTGGSFRLLHVWSKQTCDGEGFEWDNRDRWQVFPTRAEPPRQPSTGFDGPSRSKCEPRCSHQSNSRLGNATSALSTKNQAQPVASAMKPAPDDR
jgi:hypothetical protein